MFSHFTSFVFIQLAKRLFATVVFPGVCVCVVLRWFGHCFKISACTFGRSFNISINAMTIQIIFSVYAGSAAASWSRYRCWITILVNIFTWWYLRKPTEATQYQLIIVFMENANCPNIIRTMRKWKNDNVHVVCISNRVEWKWGCLFYIHLCVNVNAIWSVIQSIYPKIGDDSGQTNNTVYISVSGGFGRWKNFLS